MDLVKEYLEKTIRISEESLDDYGSKVKTAAHNRRAGRIRKIATIIETEHPELKEAFYQLLFYDNQTVQIWGAHHILEVMNYSDEYRRHALRRIAVESKQEDCSGGFGEKIWLREWLNQHPQDKKFL